MAALHKKRTPISLRKKHENTIFITHGEQVIQYPVPDPHDDPWLHALKLHKNEHQDYKQDQQRIEVEMLMDRFDRKLQRAEENYRAQLRSRGNKSSHLDLKVATL